MIAKYILMVFVLLELVNISCKKERSCEGCKELNKPPIAIAGPDQVITLPADSILLDGRNSSDPDGTISNWLWTKISGPASFNIIKQSDSITKVKALVVGTYQFELTVTDNDGLSSKDTVRVIVNDPLIPNRPPVANAGMDQSITLPANTITLNGNGSTDPDNNITSYLWTKISGPSLFSIANASAIQTQITNLTEGIYQFELKVTDAGGLFSKDSIQIVVIPQPSSILPCDNSSRPLVNAHLVPFATIPGAAIDIAVASGAKILFAGAPGNLYEPRPLRVDIYDTLTLAWSTALLNEGRWNMAAVAAGNKVFFAGGRLGDGAFDLLFATVDIYDVSTNTWSVASLSKPRCYIAAAAVGSKVFFAGGEKDWDYNTTNTVDIYDISTNTWSTSLLSQQRSFISAVTVNNKIYFAGGHIEDRWYQNPSNLIDIYDNITNTWSTSSLLAHMGFVSSIAVNEKIYWAAGCPVEIRNVNTGNSSILNLFKPGGTYSVIKDGKIVFIAGGDKFDIYDTTTNTWSIGVLPQPITVISIISVNNTIYVVGYGIGGLSNQVWKLEF